MCLYDWISKCRRVKQAKKKPNLKKKTTQRVLDIDAVDDDQDNSSVEQDVTSHHSASDVSNPNRVTKSTGILPFLSSHPLSETHGVSLLKATQVPNFIGNTLPRHDQGDREYYCSTMLALFKPWRSGLDLRTSINSWDETFVSHRFSSRQVELMKNMNIRYECLDSRDDFHAELKKGAASEMPGWMESDAGILNDLDQMAVDDAIHGPATSMFDEFSMSPIAGKRKKSCTGLMAEIRRVLVSLGWTKCEAKLLPDGLNISPDPLEPQTPAYWKATVSKRRAKILEVRAHHRHSNTNRNGVQVPGPNTFVQNSVHVVDKSYMTRSFYSKEWQKEIDGVSNSFNLNKEQERAFRIVANHACSPDSEQLKMYVAGMGGTGKTQVLKALVEFFKIRNESHRFTIVAPTGSAAALLQGSTYHSMLGINSDGKPTSAIQLAQVKERLEGVDYIFLDEVSMLSCRDMYLISARLARVMNNLEAPFGGLNIIFAGDFAQLPPVIGHESASLYSRTVGKNPTSLRQQEAAIGKALWHQVTTVVILRQNMRQRTQSTNDAKFREALSNMRYKACTPSDIAFLRTLISSEVPGRSSVNEKQFRNVSIITNLNSQKDEINRLGSQRFATETSQNLTHFYSIDTVASNESEEGQPKKNINARRKRIVKYNSIPEKIQQALWEQPTCANTKLIPGKLSICLGMPIMIRNNAATEMCITKGQEATVHAWDSHKTAEGRDVLDTLFVELTNPPTPVKLDGLPLNVIPLTRTSITTSCRLPDDTSLTVSRSQVEAMPNFAMTDYASQGKTRPYNVVELSQCHSHQSYYTALSRSASAAGTLILNTIHPSKITGGASGALRQEFRELELLDNITTLIFNEKLPRKVTMGDRRNILIDQFREYKGKSYIPSSVHPAIRWSKTDPFLEWQECVDWRVINSKTDGIKANLNLPPHTDETLASTPDVVSRLQGIVSPAKRKLSYIVPDVKKPKIKKLKFTHLPDDPSNSIRLNIPLGTRWQNNSCAYDAVITVLFNIWRGDAISETGLWHELQCELLDSLTQSFYKHEDNEAASASVQNFTLEEIRDFFRRHLARFSSEFTFGSYASVHSIVEQFLKTCAPVTTSQLCCPNNHEILRNQSSTSNCEIIINPQAGPSLQACVDNFTIETASKCSTCNMNLSRVSTFMQTPPLLAFDLGNIAPFLDPIIWVPCQDTCVRYSLRGIIYFENGHFTEHVITSTGMAWFHDGMFTGRSLVYETNDLTSISRDHAVMAFYSREQNN